MVNPNFSSLSTKLALIVQLKINNNEVKGKQEALTSFNKIIY